MPLDLDEYQTIVENSPNMIWRAGLDAKCDYFNKTWLDFTGRTFEQEVGNGWAEGVHPDDFDRCLKIYLENFENRTPFEMEYRLRRYDDVYRWINDRGTPVFVGQSEFVGFIGSCVDVTDRVEGEKLKFKALKDGLTGANNRQYFMDLFMVEFQRAVRYGTRLSVIMLDLDRFKRINDTYGHLLGDRVLIRVAEIVHANLRSFDVFGRFGGEEFTIVLPNSGLEEAVTVAERLRSEMAAASIAEGSQIIRFSASFGVAALDGDQEPYKLINRADMAMYQSKANGRNQVMVSAGDVRLPDLLIPEKSPSIA